MEAMKRMEHTVHLMFILNRFYEKNMSSVPIQRFRGNRFNILLTNAAAVYFLIPKIKEFLIYNDSNRLLKS